METKGEVNISPKYSRDDYLKLNLSVASGDSDWETAVNIFKDRIQGRYLNQIDLLSCDINATGFAIMALNCLLIEALYQFENGLKETKSPNKEKYAGFLKQIDAASFSADTVAEEFYTNIRCGILHSAQTKAESRLSDREGFVVAVENNVMVVSVKGVSDLVKKYFDGCKKAQLLFDCPAGSAAEEYAKSHNINIARAKKDSNDPTAAFSYTVSKNKTVKINAYISRESKVIIPGTIEGCPVVAFNKDVFKNNKKIISVVWPPEIPVLPKEIFFGCSALKEVILPEGVTEISEKAFRNCESLTSIEIPATVVAINEKAFECAKNTFSGWEYWNCVKTIRGAANSSAERFSKAVKIKFISTSGAAEERAAMSKYSYHEVADGIALDDFAVTDDMSLNGSTFGLDKFEIPNEILGQPVVELSASFHKGEDKSWYNRIAETIIIPQNLKRIRCPLKRRGIKNVIVSPDNKSIIFDEYAWYEDGGKTIVSTWLDVDWFKEYTIKEGAIQACEAVDQEFSLEKLVFPASFTKIHKGFLIDRICLVLKSTVEKIYANYDSCMRQYAAEINADFIALDRQDVVFSDAGAVLVSCPQLFPETVYRIPESVRQIEKNAFKGNELIKEIIIPDSVEVIGQGAFSKCSALEKVVLPKKITELADMLFADCKKLKIVEWPESLHRIGKKCFANTSLKSIALPDTVAEIDDYAFTIALWKQNAFASIELPKSVRKLGISVCAGIKDITVYDSIDPDAEPAKDYYDEDNGYWNSRVGCIGILQYERYMEGACNSKIFNHTITVKSAADNSIKYKVLMYGDEEARNVYCAMVSSWGKNAEFRFSSIDKKFSKLKNAGNRLATVLNRLAYPIDLSDDAKERYLVWIKRNAAIVAMEFIEKGDLSGLICYEQYGIITKNNVQKLIDLAVSKKNVEISAYLLEYKTKL